MYSLKNTHRIPDSPGDSCLKLGKESKEKEGKSSYINHPFSLGWLRCGMWVKGLRLVSSV